jgi:hypothetical protein
MEIQEKFLHHIWDQRHLLPDLHTVTGKSVKIIYQGQYNTSNGPDFRHAVLNIDGETLQGDVEIHQKTYDWTAHQHQEDFAYNGTILHVVLEHKGNDGYTIREDAIPIEILELKDQIDTDIAKLFVQYTQNPPQQHQGMCDFFQLSSQQQLPQLLQEYGWERFLRKCSRFNAELHFNSFDQLLYNGFMEAIGYDKNKFNTLSLAHHFTWHTLADWEQQGLDETALAAIWLNYSGLKYKVNSLLSPELAANLNKAYELQPFSTDQGILNWNLFRIRPANHPVKRILQASSIIIALLRKGFLASLLPWFESSGEIEVKEFNKYLEQVLYPSVPTSKEIGLPGQSLLQVMAGNIILPIMYLYAEKVNNPALQNKVREIYLHYPPQGENYIIKFMLGYLGQDHIKTVNRSFVNQQGLINIYYRFCSYRLCDLCLSEKQKLLQAM